MKSIRRCFYIIFAVAILAIGFTFSTSAVSWLSGECGENVNYIYNCDSGELSISGEGSMYDYTASFSPFFNMKVESVYIGEGVTKIGDFAFECCTKLKNVFIPDSVTVIGNRAFINCDRLDGVILPEKIEKIDEYAFYGCEKLQSIILPQSLKEMGSHSFSDCIGLESVIISGGINEIKDSAFESCTALKSVILSNGVESIGESAFKFCFKLKSVMLSNSLSEVSAGAFNQCYALENIYFGGEEENWGLINIDNSGNEYFKNAEVILNEHIHDYSSNTYLKPTCEADGNKTYVCSCGDEIIKLCGKTAHNYKGSIAKATLSTDGKIQVKCDSCGKVQENRTISYVKTVKMEKTAYTYTGKKIEPPVIVNDKDGNALQLDTDYTVSYEGTGKLPGKYKAVITFIGDYTGSKTLEFTVAPKAAANLKGKAQTTTSITLSYSKSVGATGYRIYKYNSGTKKYDAIKTTTALSYKVSKLNAGSKYIFKVRPYCKATDGTVIWGGYSAALTVGTKPATPKIKSCTLKNSKVTVTWSDIAGESGYQIYYSTSKNGSYKKLANVKANTTTYTSQKLSAGKTYYFKLRAYKKVGDTILYSSFSETKAVKLPTVYYVTKSGKKYHVENCPSLSKSKIKISYKDAVAKGYKPCSTCIK